MVVSKIISKEVFKLTKVKFKLDFSIFGYSSVLEQLKAQGYEIDNKKSINEIKQYENLITSVNFSHLMDIVTEVERKNIFKRVGTKISKLVNEEQLSNI